MVQTTYRARRRVEDWQPVRRRVDGGGGAAPRCGHHPRTHDARRGGRHSGCEVSARHRARHVPTPRLARPPAPVVVPRAATRPQHVRRWSGTLLACLGALGLLVLASASVL